MSKNWAICIGINGYSFLRPLKYARQDAAAMRDFCLSAGFEQVYFFAEQADPIRQDYGPPLPSEPTVGNLERFFRVRFEEGFLEAGDNLWFFFAGHGKRFQGRDYLMPVDGDPGNVGRTGLAIRDISDRLRRCGADNIVLMLDACRGEDDRDGGEGIGVEKQQGVITLFSCSPSELSYEIDELQQGAFTYALLQGLRIQGEGNCATVERLYQHLRYQVPDLNRRYRKQPQTPYAIVEPATKLHLILLPGQATLQDVQALKVDALEAEAEDDWALAEQLWIRVLVVSPGDRQAVKALQRIALRLSQQLSKLKPSKPSGTTQGGRSSSVDPNPSSQVSQLVKPPKTSANSKTKAPKVRSQPSSPRPVVSSSPKTRKVPKASRQSQNDRIRTAFPYILYDLFGRREALKLIGFIGFSLTSIVFGLRRIFVDDSSDTSTPEVKTLTATDFRQTSIRVVTVNEKGEIVSEKIKEPYVFEENVSDIILNLVPIESGTFMMGSPDGEGGDNEKPQHKVTVSQFLMGRYEVTQAQWKTVAGFPKVERDLRRNLYSFTSTNNNEENFPVCGVSWDEAVEFCKRLSLHTGRDYRLPSEAEWEYACRAGTTTPFHFGDTITPELANYDSNYAYGSGPKGTPRLDETDVGSFPANAFGLYDMHGNVSEWCLDHWHFGYEGAPTGGNAWFSNDGNAARLVRGGSRQDDPTYCRAAARGGLARDNTGDFVGFRVVCSSLWTL